jgi:hypothetical protein
MKYIKTFEYQTDNSLQELQNFCNDHLAYLIDRGIKVIVNQQGDSYYIFIGNVNNSRNPNISFNNKENTKGLKWSDIKDDIITFLIILKDKFKHNLYNFIKFKKIHTSYVNNTSKSYELESKYILENIIEDKLEDIDNIYYIRITIDI